LFGSARCFVHSASSVTSICFWSVRFSSGRLGASYLYNDSDSRLAGQKGEMTRALYGIC
jgi:hypothetical protein